MLKCESKNNNLKIPSKICSKCIYDESVPSISFNKQGICNYCEMVEGLIKEFNTGLMAGEDTINRIIKDIKYKGRNKKYDCIVGISGGTDSSYMLYWAIKNGLRPLAVHYDNTWNSAIATENIKKILSKLKVDLFTHVVNNKESDDIFRSFFLADVPEIDAATDLGYAETIYRAACKFKVQYTLEGHSYVAEGITPLGKNYFDGKYIQSIHNKFGRLPLKTYPLMTFNNFIKWTVVKKIKKIRPFWYINYSKEEAKTFLKKEFGWEDYGGHHLENRMSAFNHSFYFPKKFNIDYRCNALSASVRSGMMSREEALHEFYFKEPTIDPTLIEYVLKRFEMDKTEFDLIMKRPPKYWHEYPTYKKRFEKLKPLFYILMKSDLVPYSFYKKYCFPVI